MGACGPAKNPCSGWDVRGEHLTTSSRAALPSFGGCPLVPAESALRRRTRTPSRCRTRVLSLRVCPRGVTVWFQRRFGHKIFNDNSVAAPHSSDVLAALGCGGGGQRRCAACTDMRNRRSAACIAPAGTTYTKCSGQILADDVERRKGRRLGGKTRRSASHEVLQGAGEARVVPASKRSDFSIAVTSFFDSGAQQIFSDEMGLAWSKGRRAAKRPKRICTEPMELASY